MLLVPHPPHPRALPHLPPAPLLVLPGGPPLGAGQARGGDGAEGAAAPGRGVGDVDGALAAPVVVLAPAGVVKGGAAEKRAGARGGVGDAAAVRAAEAAARGGEAVGVAAAVAGPDPGGCGGGRCLGGEDDGW